MFNGQEIIHVEGMIGKKWPVPIFSRGAKRDEYLKKWAFYKKTPNNWGFFILKGVIYCNHKSDLV
jgi:hypothetical protein